MDMPDMKPTVYLTTKDLSAIKSWKVGQTYEVLMKIKQISIRDNGDGVFSASFEIQDIMQPEPDEADLEEINSISNNSDFMKAAAGKKAHDYNT